MCVVVVCCCCLQSSVYSLFSSRVLSLSLSLCSSSNKRIYQVRGHLRTSPKIAVKVEGSLYHRSANGNSGGVGSQQQAASTSSTANILHPACVLNGSFISQTFQILYRNEDVSLSDMAQFRLHVLVDSHKVSTTTTTVSTQLTSLALPAFTIDFFPSLLSFSLSLFAFAFVVATPFLSFCLFLTFLPSAPFYFDVFVRVVVFDHWSSFDRLDWRDARAVGFASGDGVVVQRSGLQPWRFRLGFPGAFQQRQRRRWRERHHVRLHSDSAASFLAHARSTLPPARPLWLFPSGRSHGHRPRFPHRRPPTLHQVSLSAAPARSIPATYSSPPPRFFCLIKSRQPKRGNRYRGGKHNTDSCSD